VSEHRILPALMPFFIFWIKAFEKSKSAAILKSSFLFIVMKRSNFYSIPQSDFLSFVKY